MALDHNLLPFEAVTELRKRLPEQVAIEIWRVEFTGREVLVTTWSGYEIGDGFPKTFTFTPEEYPLDSTVARLCLEVP